VKFAQRPDAVALRAMTGSSLARADARPARRTGSAGPPQTARVCSGSKKYGPRDRREHRVVLLVDRPPRRRAWLTPGPRISWRSDVASRCSRRTGGGSSRTTSWPFRLCDNRARHARTGTSTVTFPLQWTAANSAFLLADHRVAGSSTRRRGEQPRFGRRTRNSYQRPHREDAGRSGRSP